VENLTRWVPHTLLTILLVTDLVLVYAVFSRDEPDVADVGGDVGRVVSRDSSARPTEASSPTSRDHGISAPSRPAIQLNESAYFARPFEMVRVRGRYPRSDFGTKLQVQLRHDHRWMSFPLVATTDRAGRFTAHVEWGASGRYRLRVVDAQRNTVSPVAILHVS